MPITPLHFGPGLALKSVTGEWFSFTLFCFAQVLIDLEPAWYMLAGNALLLLVYIDTLYLGCAVAGAAGVGLGLFNRWRALRRG